MWGEGVNFDHDDFLAAQNEEFDEEEKYPDVSGGGVPYSDDDDEDLKARTHMRLAPDHEVIVGTDDMWHCVTCERMLDEDD